MYLVITYIHIVARAGTLDLIQQASQPAASRREWYVVGEVCALVRFHCLMQWPYVVYAAGSISTIITTNNNYHSESHHRYDNPHWIAEDYTMLSTFCLTLALTPCMCF